MCCECLSDGTFAATCRAPNDKQAWCLLSSSHFNLVDGKVQVAFGPRTSTEEMIERDDIWSQSRRSIYQRPQQSLIQFIVV
jgi:hypothetical protein